MVAFKTIDEFIRNNDQEGFEQYLSKQNTSFFQSYWNHNGKQLTLLDYLISQYEETPQKEEVAEHSSAKGKEIASEDEEERKKEEQNVFVFIQILMRKSQKFHTGTPIHQATKEGKLQLARTLIENTEFSLNSYDKDGNSLLKLVLETRDKKFIQFLLSQERLNPHQPFDVKENSETIEMQPIHYAIYLDFPEAVEGLAKRGADLNNSCNQEQNYPIHLAAKYGSEQVMRGLLEAVEKPNLEHLNSKQQTAIELACARLKEAKGKDEKQSLLSNISLLLCYGAQLPRKEFMKNFLKNHADELLEKMNEYLSEHTELVEAFVDRCHDRNDDLHSFFYDTNPLSTAFKHLFGKPNNRPLIIEGLITKKYKDECTSKEHVSETDKVKFARFVQTYREMYKDDTISNPWSKMHMNIACGTMTSWKSVTDYANEHPKSRTAKVLKRMEETAKGQTLTQMLNN